MDQTFPLWDTPETHVRAGLGDMPALYLCPSALQARARRFLAGFPGMVTYAVKANPSREVVENLATAGITGFDVASVAEIELVRSITPKAALHYNNPVRSRGEIIAAARMGVRSWSVDSASELAKLAELLADHGAHEISVRFKLPVSGATYDFGAKFGAEPGLAAELLAQTAAFGFRPSLTFHPGTQCIDPDAWRLYIAEAARIVAQSGIAIERLNVGGGFPSSRGDGAPEPEAFFTAIAEAMAEHFPESPALVCEPGRGLVADAFAVALRVRAVRDGGDVFLNDGIYGLMSEQHILGRLPRIRALRPDGSPVGGAPVARRLFGPTCDSIDVLPGLTDLPADIAEGDVVLFGSMGAYSTATSTSFNGFGEAEMVSVHNLTI